MQLYLLRHGDAADRVTGGYERDEDRPLTEKGREEARRAAAALANLGVAVDLLLTSPLLRASQTATLAAERLRPRRGPERSAAFAPGRRPEETLDALRSYEGEDTEPDAPRRVVLVGHMPDLGNLAGWLVWGRGDLTVTLRTGGLCRIDLPGRPGAARGELRWLLPPALLRRL
ncbi:MAG: hypothetical protein AVDCRST_MAG88-1127 [uncultured Thermomicrobiales bacterium]|uniref:Phosphohistidine phosphatase SixA n=1 Tax=uncultured Thermomicrobiales bacterium TaxID=1645740 RepID=A0A6J4UNW9_9BACT|nr:MAG: hypothetical protein AVDCRST_MAG88-1127 [uncultured Thermomicrobiales bacterium]